MIPPKRFDMFPLTGGCPEGLDAFIFFFKNKIVVKPKVICTASDIFCI